MPMSASFEEVIKAIHSEMECENVTRKPELKYKMEKTGSSPINLVSEKDWSGMKAHAKALGKKDAIICTILVDKEVSYILMDHECLLLQYLYLVS